MSTTKRIETDGGLPASAPADALPVWVGAASRRTPSGSSNEVTRVVCAWAPGNITEPFVEQ